MVRQGPSIGLRLVCLIAALGGRRILAPGIGPLVGASGADTTSLRSGGFPGDKPLTGSATISLYFHAPAGGTTQRSGPGSYTRHFEPALGRRAVVRQAVAAVGNARCEGRPGLGVSGDLQPPPVTRPLVRLVAFGV